MKKFIFKSGLQITASSQESAKVIATRVNRVGNNTTEFAYPVLDTISKRLISKIPSSKISRIRQGYALIDTPKGYQIEFEMNDSTKDSFVRILKDSDVTKEFKINNWYDNTIPELYEKVSNELKEGMKAAASAVTADLWQKRNPTKTQDDLKLEKYITKFELSDKEKEEIKKIVEEFKNVNSPENAVAQEIVDYLVKENGYATRKDLYKDCQCDLRGFLNFAKLLLNK